MKQLMNLTLALVIQDSKEIWDKVNEVRMNMKFLLGNFLLAYLKVAWLSGHEAIWSLFHPYPQQGWQRSHGCLHFLNSETNKGVATFKIVQRRKYDKQQ